MSDAREAAKCGKPVVWIGTVDDGTLTISGPVAHFTSSDVYACSAWLKANGLHHSRLPYPEGAGIWRDDTRVGMISYGKVPCRPNECWSAVIWPREMGETEPCTADDYRNRMEWGKNDHMAD